MGRVGALAFVGAVLVGCGGSGGGGQAPPGCLTVGPCGGDLVGTWRFVGGCAADTATFTDIWALRCGGSTVKSYDVGASGSITFNADLTYSAQGWNSTSSVVSTSPETCGNGTSCADQSFSVTSSDGSFKQTCSGSGVCTCMATGLSAVTETGTYSTASIQFELVGPTTSRTRRYCVQEPFLHVLELGLTSTDQDATLMLLTDSVAMRQ